MKISIEKRHCPLCGEQDAVFESEYKDETIVHPAPEGTIGNFTMGHSGGEWNYSHASKCPMLRSAIRKEDLLAYHVHGYPTPSTLSDLLSIDEYNEQLKQWGLEIGYSSKRVDAQWEYTVFIKERSGLERKDLFTKAKDYDTAFEYLRHRLLCGEVFSFERTGTIRYRQLRGENGAKKINVIDL